MKLTIKKFNIDKKLLFIVVFIIVLIVSIFISIPAEKHVVTPEPSYKTVKGTKFNVWKNVVPGETVFDKNDSRYGEYKTRKIINGIDIYYYLGENKVLSNTEVAVSNDVVQYIKIPIAYKDDIFLNNFSKDNGLGDPDIVRYNKYDPLEQVYVYLSEGLALNVNYFNDQIVGKTFFKPISENEFMKIWGNRLSTEPSTYTDGPN